MDTVIHKTIVKFCYEFKKRNPHILDEVDDLICEAYVLLPKIEKMYDKEQHVLFTTFLWNGLYRYFLDMVESDRSGVFTSLDELTESEEYPIEFPSQRITSFPPAFLNSLSNNARLYVETILDFPEELETFMSRKNKKYPFKYQVGQYLGFNKTEVHRIQQEVLEKYIY